MTEAALHAAHLQAALKHSVDDVLEKMFFARSFGERPDVASQLEFRVRVYFEGERRGWLALYVSAAAAGSMAADFLGEEEAVLSDQQIGDVICELANMICGSVLSRIETNSTFHLGAPELVLPGENENFQRHPAFSPPISHAAEIGNGRLVVTFNMEADAWPTAAKFVY